MACDRASNRLMYVFYWFMDTGYKPAGTCISVLDAKMLPLLQILLNKIENRALDFIPLL